VPVIEHAFVDAHVHYWDPARLRYPWLAAEPSIAAAHLPAQLRAEAGETLGSVVFVQAECDRGQWLDEVSWAEALSREDARLAAFVAFAPMDRGPDTIAALDALRRRPLVRGVRHLLQDEADPAACHRPAFVAGVRGAGDRGLSFDLCVRHGQLPGVLELVRACPNTRFILDHAGKPDVRGAQLDPWRAHIEDLAGRPNVVCKISGLITEASRASWEPDHLRPFVDHLVECFGPERLLFGSDWPVVKLAATYQRWRSAAAALVEHLPESARRSIFVDTARRTYRLP
jgi:L-fuconolactonase